MTFTGGKVVGNAQGGAVFLQSSNSIVKDCVFSKNTTGKGSNSYWVGKGAAVYSTGGSLFSTAGGGVADGVGTPLTSSETPLEVLVAYIGLGAGEGDGDPTPACWKPGWRLFDGRARATFVSATLRASWSTVN